MKSTCVYFVLIFSCISLSYAQTGDIRGVINSNGESMPGVNVSILALGTGVASASDGTFELRNLPEGSHLLRASLIGYKPTTLEVYVVAGQQTDVSIALEEDLLNLQQVTVTATRNAIPMYNTPVIVSQISPKTFEATQSLSLSEGLAFSPGLRVENNCQNCGFTQLRMNGLEGAYSQVLINSRPVFSALAGVYGLDMFPANMIDRVEVVRGGGSVLYGGNAIGGTVNIITKEPVNNSFEVALNQAFTDFDASDRTLMLNGAIVSDDLQKGMSLYGYTRNRDPWDANGDGISEITLLENNTFGFDAFYNPTHRSKLKVGAYSIHEFRRGGSQFELAPHQTEVTEQLDHKIFGSNISFEQYSADFRHKFSVYASLQATRRDSYYGAGGRILAPGDSLTNDDLLAINAYGRSQDLAAVGGLQYNYDLNDKINITAGTEYQHYDLTDAMPGYGRSIEQRVATMGNYAQLQLTPLPRLSFLLGGRFDAVNINGRYDLVQDVFDNQKTLGVFVPRASAMYDLSENLKLRASFAQGYRAPQVFDEDLHIQTVGGDVLFIQLDPELETERSNSYTASLNYTRMQGSKQLNFVAEAFHTRLNNPFILSDQVALDNGIAVITKRNGDAAIVQGMNLEANVALSRKFIFQSGVTLQSARYTTEEEIWAPEADDDFNPATTTSRLLRTPDVYGYFTLQYRPMTKLAVYLSAVYTGPMDVPHVIGSEFSDSFTVIKRSPGFFEQNLKTSWDLYQKEGYRLQVFAGIQNLFNAYQDDLDFGPERDAGYIYGPSRPRTVFFGLKFGLN